jgi:L-arabinose isomerase
MIFENYEVWFITGAQLLYGGDAVVKWMRTQTQW